MCCASATHYEPLTDDSYDVEGAGGPSTAPSTSTGYPDLSDPATFEAHADVIADVTAADEVLGFFADLLRVRAFLPVINPCISASRDQPTKGSADQSTKEHFIDSIKC